MACEEKSNGCDGGYQYYAFVHWRDHGLVTGGLYGSKNVSEEFDIKYSIK